MNEINPIQSQAGLASTPAPLRVGWAAARRSLATTADASATVARATLALVMLPHGTQHALGWLGGYGFRATVGWMTGTLGIPPVLAALAVATELCAPLLLLFGLASRLAATGILVLMLVAARTHVGNGFFMNWFGTLPSGHEGFEYHLLALALAAVVLIKGGGRLAIDGWLTSQR
jgi:putative oxidoreductase